MAENGQTESKRLRFVSEPRLIKQVVLIAVLIEYKKYNYTITLTN